MRLLLVEDDRMIGEATRTGLRQDGFVVDWVRDGEAAELALSGTGYDALLLDLALPAKSGLEVLRGLRTAGNDLPVLILTARDGVSDRVEGLNAGADDYLVKPFELAELAARVRAISRRRAGRSDSTLQFGELRLDPATHAASFMDRPLTLSSKEFALLQSLMEAAGSVLSRGQLEEKLYGWDEEVESNAVQVHVHRLRKKLGRQAIQTVRGIGYALRGTA